MAAIYDLNRVYDVCKVIDIFTGDREGCGKYATRVPGVVLSGVFQYNNCVYIIKKHISSLVCFIS